MIDGFTPAGRFFCRGCFGLSDFVLTDDASPDDKEPAIECFVCGFTYDRVHVEVDALTGERMPPNLSVQSPIPYAKREAARAEMRDEFMSSALRGGYRRENFNNVGRRRRGSE